MLKRARLRFVKSLHVRNGILGLIDPSRNVLFGTNGPDCRLVPWYDRRVWSNPGLSDWLVNLSDCPADEAADACVLGEIFDEVHPAAHATRIIIMPPNAAMGYFGRVLMRNSCLIPAFTGRHPIKVIGLGSDDGGAPRLSDQTGSVQRSHRPPAFCYQVFAKRE